MIAYTLLEHTVQSRNMFPLLSLLLGVFIPVPEDLMSAEGGVPVLKGNSSCDELDEPGRWAR